VLLKNSTRSRPQGRTADKPSSNAKIGCVLPSDKAVIHRENTGNRSTVRSINEAAFGRPDEADLVERLWSEGVVLVSLVAEVRRQIVGHILFSRMSIDTARASIPAVALAPMAVLPEYQRRAIGGQLIRGGLDLLCGQRERIILVLGHPDYYQSLPIQDEPEGVTSGCSERGTILTRP
jgi:putative acetyltransferase